MNIKPHSVIVTVGPSHAGKSFWCQSCLIRQLKDKKYEYISSDNLRRELLGADLHKYDADMYSVSNQAFSLLDAKLKAHTSYPVNTEYVIVDSTALNLDFLESIKKVCQDNHYNLHLVIFDYKDYTNYYEGAEDANIVKRHVTKFKKNILPSLSKISKTKTFVKSKEDYYLDIVLEQNPYKTQALSTDKYSVIGDIHGCHEELKELVDKLDNTNPIILVGDYLDKSNDQQQIETVNYLHNNLDKFTIVRGNHERFFINNLANGNSLSEELIAEHFSSTLIDNEEFIAKVSDIYAASYDFITTPNSIITHSPCKVKYLGKTDKIGLKNQANYRYLVAPGESIQEKLSFIYEEDHSCWNKHIFGHIALNRAYKGRSKLGIDTGCVFGGSLTAAVSNGSSFHFVRVQSKQADRTSKLVSLEKDRPIIVSSETEKRISWIVRDKVNYLKPTMSPSNASDEFIETIENALKYFKDNGEETVCLQPKHMGSNIQLYLNKIQQDSYIVTRNGYRLKEERLGYLWSEIDRIYRLFDWTKYSQILLDCELMPWSFLGEGLINRNFKLFGELSKQQLNNKSVYKIDALIESVNNPELIDAYKSMSKKEFIDKYKHHNYRSISNYLAIKELGSNTLSSEDTEAFNRQIEIFGGHSDPYIRPFAILRKITTDIEPIVESNKDQYRMFYDYRDVLGCKEVSVNDIESAKSYVSDTVELELEGVVVKPQFPQRSQ